MSHPQQQSPYKTKLIFKILKKCDPLIVTVFPYHHFMKMYQLILLHCKSEIYFYFLANTKIVVLPSDLLMIEFG